MEIKNIDLLSQAASARQRQDKRTSETVSFMDYMKSRVQSPSTASVPDSGFSVSGLFEANGIEAIGARARIQHDTGGDVTDFLELIGKKPFLLEGADLSGIGGVSDAKPLSAEDSRRLRDSFDMDNLPPSKQRELFSELAKLGALGKSDIQKLRLSVSPGEDDLMGYLTNESGFTDVSAISDSEPKSRLEAMISNERFVADHIQSRYGKLCISVSELANSHERVLNILNAI